MNGVRYTLATNCLAYCSGGVAQRSLEIAGISLPVIPILTQFPIRFDSTCTLENLSHKASSGLWPLSWRLSCEMTLQQISFCTAGSLLSQEFWLIYIWRKGVSKIIPILSIIMMVLGYFNTSTASSQRAITRIQECQHAARPLPPTVAVRRVTVQT